MEGSMQRRQNTKKWTVMVFMGAATIDGEEDLLDAAEDDLLEMASVGPGQCGSTAKMELNIFVQVYARQGSEQGTHKTSARFGKIEQKKFGSDREATAW